MSNLELPHRSIAVVTTEVIICLAVNFLSITGNSLVCLAVHRNPNLRSTTNLYIIALAVSDLLCATVLMPFTSAALIIGRWDFSEFICQIHGFIGAFTTYVTPATMGLTAFNRYMRIVKTNHYNKIFSPHRSKICLSSVWLFLLLYLLLGRVSNWFKFEFFSGYAVCASAFTKPEIRIIHYCIVFGLLFLLPFCIGFFSYYKILRKTRQHQQNIVTSLQSTINNGTVTSSVREVNINRILFYVTAGFLLCWIPMWALVFWKRFSPDIVPRIAEVFVTFLYYLSASINPFIYTFTNGTFRREFAKLLRCWKGTRTAPQEVAENVVQEREEVMAV